MKSAFIMWSLIGSMLLCNVAVADRPPIDPNADLHIIYGAPELNRNKKKVDTAIIVLKDGDSGRITSLELAETGVNSSTFRAKVKLSAWSDLRTVYPEVYTPSRKQFSSKGNLEQFVRGVKSKRYKRRPVIFKTHRNGNQILDIYTTRNSHSTAVTSYKRVIQIDKAHTKLSRKLRQNFPEQDLIDQATIKEKIEFLNKLELLEEQKQVERNRRVQLMTEEMNGKQLAFNKLSKTQKAKRQSQAKNNSNLAIKNYKEQKYSIAEKLFKKSFQKDPTNTNFYFYYGVTLYRLKKFDDALLFLEAAKVDRNSEIERDYYKALSHYQLNELTNAIILFRKVKQQNHPKLSPSSSLYEGLVLFGQEKYIEAKAPFEWVIDHSGDPKLDDQAESYIEQIAWKVHYKRAKVFDWILQADLEFSYDSNILYATDSQQDQGQIGLADVRDGYRSEAILDVEYRIFYEKEHALSANFNTAYMYSSKSDFKRADHWLTEVSLPYTRKGELFDKTSQWSATPLYKILYMDANDTGAREEIQGSGGAEAKVTLAMSEHYFSTYNLGLLSENSTNIDDISGNDNADAWLLELGTNQSFYIDKFNKRAITPTLKLMYNSAEGDNKNYQRADLGLTYVDSTWWNSTWYANANLYLLEFPNHDEERKDTNYSISLGIEKPLSKVVSWGFSLSYADNQSNVNSNDYSKFIALTSFGFDLEM